MLTHVLTILLATSMTAVHEALVILYTRGITKERVWIVVIVTGFLALFGFLATEVMIHDKDMKWPMTIGHMLGVPLGFAIRIDGEPSSSSRASGPKAAIGFRSSSPSSSDARDARTTSDACQEHARPPSH